MSDDAAATGRQGAEDWVMRGLEWAAWVQGMANTMPPEEWHNHLPGTAAILAEPLPLVPFLRQWEAQHAVSSPITEAAEDEPRQEPEPMPKSEPEAPKPATQLDGGWRLR